jgi:hypothetical protein
MRVIHFIVFFCKIKHFVLIVFRFATHRLILICEIVVELAEFVILVHGSLLAFLALAPSVNVFFTPEVIILISIFEVRRDLNQLSILLLFILII